MRTLNDPLNIILADDDPDDRFFFAKALQELDIPSKLVTHSNGERLMSYLEKCKPLPDVLFLDLNMPRKNGNECLLEIKKNKKLSALPVVIYSTSLSIEVAEVLYDNGAMYYLQKCDFSELLSAVHIILVSIMEGSGRPARENFILHGKPSENR